MNNKGFTLVELLAVIVILLALALMAGVGISAVIERNKDRTNDTKKEIIKSAGVLYVKENKNTFDYDSFIKGECGISFSKLLDNDYISEDDLIDEGRASVDCIMYEDGEYILYTDDGMCSEYC